METHPRDVRQTIRNARPRKDRVRGLPLDLSLVKDATKLDTREVTAVMARPRHTFWRWLLVMVLATCIQLWRPTTAWAFGVTTKLTGDEDGYGYGETIAASGDWIFVGQQQPFKTFVYHLTSRGWVETQQLPFIAGESSYAMAGGELYVGHPYDDTVGQDVGAIARYGLSGDQWVVQETIYPMGSEAGEMFGITVAVEGDSMMVGASQSGAGALYVFDRVGGVWTQQQRLVPSDGVSGASFGYTFARDGADVLVGAPTQDGGGAVYVFQEQAGQWVETQKLVGGTYNFGGRLVRDGDTAAVSAAMESHVVERQGGTWSVVATIAGGGVRALEGDLAVLAGQVVRRTSAGWVPIAVPSLKNGVDGCSATLVDVANNFSSQWSNFANAHNVLAKLCMLNSPTRRSATLANAANSF